MNIKVAYHSSTGNTKKLATAISNEVGVKAESIEDITNFSDSVDLLFIGDGVYFGKPKKLVIDFISKLNPEIVKNVAVFATCGGQEKIRNDIKQLLENQGLNIINDPFVCKGQSWLIMNRKQPNEDDLKRVSQFAKNTVSKVNN